MPGGHNQTGLLYHRPLWFVQQATHVMVVVQFGASQAVLHTVNFSVLLQVLIGAERNLCSVILDDVSGKSSDSLLNDRAVLVKPLRLFFDGTI